MNASSQSMYMAKKQLIESDIQTVQQQMPEIERFVQSLSSFPSRTLNDIMVRKEVTSFPSNVAQSMNTTASKYEPDCIVGDWLYLGDHSHCKSLETLQRIGITHILCCSNIIPTYFVSSNFNIKYARIPIPDSICADLWNMLYAAKQFIDLCNPSVITTDTLHNERREGDGNQNGDTRQWRVSGKKKILVHCECGISRSSAIVIGYLLATKVMLTSDQLDRFQRIQWGLKKFKRRKRNLYRVKQVGENRVVFMKLNEAYYFVQSCRGIIEPNIGFCKQLEKWERLLHGKRSTLQDLPKFSSIKNENNLRLGRTVAMLQSNHDICSCTVL